MGGRAMGCTLAGVAALVPAVVPAAQAYPVLQPVPPVADLVLAGAVLLLTLCDVAAVLWRVRRVGRERRWLHQRIAVRTAGPAPVVSAAPEGPVSGLGIRLDVRLEPVGDDRPEMGLPGV